MAMRLSQGSLRTQLGSSSSSSLRRHGRATSSLTTPLPRSCARSQSSSSHARRFPQPSIRTTTATSLPTSATLLRPRHPASIAHLEQRRPLTSTSFTRLQNNRFGAFVPPDPTALPKPRAARTYRRSLKWSKRLIYTAIALGTAYVVDTQLYASSLTRTARTFGTGLVVALDYKINFTPEPLFADSIAEVHGRNAKRLFDLLRGNGGLYLKIGQAIAMQSAVMPPEFQKMFERMFDDAPQNEWKDVERMIREDFGGRSVEEVFGVSFDPITPAGKGVMERKARASASVAQVHWARLADGREVAIKVQKREIPQQIGWDLWAFKTVTWIYSKWFDLPFYSLVPYVTERLQLETDFRNEADNSEKMAVLVRAEPRLRDRVYIPKVHRELSSHRVMTAEWIEGVRLWDKEALTKPWRGGWREGSPGAGGRPLPPIKQQQATSSASSKPNRETWRGQNGKSGLGLSLPKVMTTMIDLFSAQMFLWGFVHCDPHPGNIFIRRLPSGNPELVLIDHGLYITMNPDFRHQYARFWKALLTLDNRTLDEIARGWGVANSDVFASATLMRPYKGGKNDVADRFARIGAMDEKHRAYEMQQAMRHGMREMLADEKKWPRELIFLGRNLRIVQGNNQFLGSPVNRIKITGTWASRALTESPDLRVGEKMANYGRHVLFRMVLWGSDVVFWISWVRQLLGWGGGMEDDIEAQMRKIAKGYGVDLNREVFDG